MNIDLAKYLTDPITKKSNLIKIIIDNVEMIIPPDPANRHYAEIMRQVEAGTLVIQPADEPETP